MQTAILANGINLASLPETAQEFRHVFSASGVISLMDDVLWASERIPDDLSAHEAANEFCGFMLANLSEGEERANEAAMTVPDWFARG